MRKKEDFIVRNIAGDNIMMPIGETAIKFNGLIMANDVAAFIWDQIENVETIEELTERICNEFEVSYEVAFEDTTKLVSQMKKAGWIE